MKYLLMLNILIANVIDIEGNNYATIDIGNQHWMAENLKVTTYNNGDNIPNVTDPVQWDNLSSGAYGYYDNDVSYADEYGALYNPFAANDDRGICPDGWRLPTYNDWSILGEYLGGSSIAGNKMKSIDLWEESDQIGTNESGFTAHPSGWRGGGCQTGCVLGLFATYHMQSDVYSPLPYTELSSSSNSLIFGSVIGGNMAGFSIRCIEDDETEDTNEYEEIDCFDHNEDGISNILDVIILLNNILYNN